MALFRNFGVNHADGVTGLESLVRHTRVSLRAMPLISLNLRKIAHFWTENVSVLFIKPRMDTISAAHVSNHYHIYFHRFVDVGSGNGRHCLGVL
jgi:hypothetical protein